MQLIFSNWIKKRGVINNKKGLKTQITSQGISISIESYTNECKIYKDTVLSFQLNMCRNTCKKKLKKKEVLKVSVMRRLDKL